MKSVVGRLSKHWRLLLSAALLAVVGLTLGGSVVRQVSAEKPALLNIALEVDGVRHFFASITGLRSESEVIEFKSGDGQVVKVPGRAKWGPIELKRGITKSMDFYNWRKLVEDGKLFRKDASVILFDGRGQESAHFMLLGAWPSVWSFSADQNTGVAEEHIELVVDRFERIQ